MEIVIVYFDEIPNAENIVLPQLQQDLLERWRLHHKDIMTIFPVFINQVQILLMGTTLLLLRIIITKDDSIWQSLRETMFNNNYFTAYLVTLWFIIIPLFVWYFDLPEYGIWAQLYKQSPLLTWCALLVVILFNGLMLWKYRRDKIIEE